MLAFTQLFLKGIRFNFARNVKSVKDTQLIQSEPK